MSKLALAVREKDVPAPEQDANATPFALRFAEVLPNAPLRVVRKNGEVYDDSSTFSTTGLFPFDYSSDD